MTNELSYLDAEGYPTDEALEKITNWHHRDFDLMIDFVRSIWWMPDWGFTIEGDKLELSTGGWSGNESIMSALQRNYIFWSVAWVSHKRGGHYEFDLSGITKLKQQQ